VKDEQVIEALRFYADQMKLVVEPTGCLGLASILAGNVDITGKRVGVIVTGGNSDMSKYKAWL
jgi:threonine dehydratase